MPHSTAIAAAFKLASHNRIQLRHIIPVAETAAAAKRGRATAERNAAAWMAYHKHHTAA